MSEEKKKSNYLSLFFAFMFSESNVSGLKIKPAYKLIVASIVLLLIATAIAGPVWGIATRSKITQAGGATQSSLDNHVSIFTPGKTETGIVKIVHYKHAWTIPLLGQTIQWGDEQELVANLPMAHYYKPMVFGNNTVCYLTDRNGHEEMFCYNFVGHVEMTMEEFAVFLNGGGTP